MTIDNYEYLKNFVVPCYRYIEGEKKEKYWVDIQNCEYFTYDKVDDSNGLFRGKKNFWIIWPCKPKGVTLTEDNQDLVKWFVCDSSVEEDENLEWDFDNHEPIKEG